MKRSVCKSLCLLLTFALLVCALPAASLAAIRTEAEDNDSYQKANPLDLGDTVRGTISSSNDVDYYKITPSESGYLELGFRYELLNVSGVSWYVTVYRFTTKNEQIYYKSTSASQESSLPRIGVEGGADYYIKISGSESARGKDYQLTVNFTKTPYWEAENNGTYLLAKETEAGKTYGGVLGTTTDTDYFKFTPKKSGYISIDLDYDLLKVSGVSWYLTVYRFTTKNEQIYYKSTSAAEKVVLPRIGVEGGADYYIKISGSESARDNAYRLTVNYTETPYWEAENNGSYLLAKETEAGKTYGGVLGTTTDTDYFKFTPEKSGYIEIDLDYDLLKVSGVSWYLTVYRFTTKNEQIYYKSTSAAEKAVLPRIGVEGGADYYIKVAGSESARDNAYRLTVNFTETPYWEAENNGSYLLAKETEAGKTYSGVLGSTTDTDYFKFTPEKDGYISIGLDYDLLKFSGVSWYVTVYRFTTKTEQIFYKSMSAAEKVVLPRIGADGGADYYIKISGSESMRDKEYSLTVGFSENALLLGDLDLDGSITASDARLALRGAVGLEHFNADFTAIGDVDFDGTITAADARKILRAAVGLETL